jgi:hypothetical protein
LEITPKHEQQENRPDFQGAAAPRELEDDRYDRIKNERPKRRAAEKFCDSIHIRKKIIEASIAKTAT